jgi:hypothetical protein
MKWEYRLLPFGQEDDESAVQGLLNKLDDVTGPGALRRQPAQASHSRVTEAEGFRCPGTLP